MREWEEFREPPSDQIWMETEQIGVGYGFIAWCALVFALLSFLVVVLPLVLS